MTLCHGETCEIDNNEMTTADSDCMAGKCCQMLEHIVTIYNGFGSPTSNC